MQGQGQRVWEGAGLILAWDATSVAIRVIFQETARISSTGTEGHQVHVVVGGVVVLDHAAVQDHVALEAGQEAAGVVAAHAVAADPEVGVAHVAVVHVVAAHAVAVHAAALGAEVNCFMQWFQNSISSELDFVYYHIFGNYLLLCVFFQ